MFKHLGIGQACRKTGTLQTNTDTITNTRRQKQRRKTDGSDETQLYLTQ